MPQTIGRGGTITLDAYYRDGTNALVDPVGPKVSIVDAVGTTVVSLADPTTHVAVGHYQYEYPVAADALLGAWEAIWYGTINGSPVEDEDGFTVVQAGSISTPDDGGPPEGPCDNWITWADVTAVGTPPTISAPLQAMVLASATRTMWERTCEQYGVCTITRARIAPLCRHAYSWHSGYGYRYRPTSRGCGCGGGHFVPLGTAPVVAVAHVWQDGVELDPTAYRVDDWARLVRVDGESWRNGAAIDAAEGDAGTVEVTWTYGVAVPSDAKLYAALLALHIAEESFASCAVPENAERVTQEGVTVIINPPKHDTGAPLVERWLDNFHCGGGRIFNPAGDRVVVRRGT